MVPGFGLGDFLKRELERNRLLTPEERAAQIANSEWKPVEEGWNIDTHDEWRKINGY